MQDQKRVSHAAFYRCSHDEQQIQNPIPNVHLSTKLETSQHNGFHIIKPLTLANYVRH